MTQSMVSDIKLDHLQEYEVQLILSVLERDAKIQRRDEERTRKLQRSIRGERLPKKRLSVKCRTGEWMKELSDQSRTPKPKGIEVVRASIRRKTLSKAQRVERVAQKSDQNQDKENKSKEQDTTSERIEEPKALAKNDDANRGTSDYAKTAEYKPNALKEGETNLQEYSQPKRKTSFRRKKIVAEKQVKFATEKTEKYVYESPKIEDENYKEEEKSSASIPTIIIDNSHDITANKPSYEEDIPSSESKKPETDKNDNEEPEKNNSHDSTSGFESYHNIVGKKIFSSEAQPVDDTPKPDKEGDKPPTPTSKIKKVKVVKRMGSSRKRGSPKITDDSSRNTVFSRMECDEAPETNETKPEEYNSKTEKMASNDLNLTPSSFADETSDTIAKELDAIAKEEYKKVVNDIKVEEEMPSLEKTQEYISSVLQNSGSESVKFEEACVAATEIASMALEEVKKEMELESYTNTYIEPKKDDEHTAETTEIVVTPSPEDISDVKKNIVEYLSSSVSGTEYPTVEKSIDAAINKVAYEAVVKEPDDPELDKGEYFPEKPLENTEVEPVSEENKNRVEIAEVILGSLQKVDGNDGEENESPTYKMKKKVVKKVIKKKAKPVDERENISNPEEKRNEVEEEKSQNMSRLERKKTVRKKVVRKKPPPET